MNQVSVGTYDIEYLLKLAGRVDAFADYVRSCDFSVNRECCAAILGFNLEDSADPVQEDAACGTLE